MRYVLVSMPNDTRWKISLDLIARRRASVYATDALNACAPQDPRAVETFHTVFDEEYERVLTDPDTILHWAEEHLHWSDIASSAEQVPPVQNMTDDQWDYGWKTGFKAIVEMPGGVKQPTRVSSGS